MLKIPFTYHDKDSVEITDDVLVYDLKSTLQKDEVVTSAALVVPPGTRGAWQAVRTAFEPNTSDQRFLVIGSPGIGEVIHERRADKSRPLPIIVYEHRKDGPRPPTTTQASTKHAL